MSKSDWSTRKVLSEDRWTRVYETEDGPVNVSKFVTDETQLSESLVKQQWDSWAESEKIAFAHAFSQKPTFSLEDERILGFLIDVGSERVWASVAGGLPRHSDRNRILKFLMDRLKSGSEPKANYASALAALGDLRAVPALEDLHGQLASAISSRSTTDNSVILDFVLCCFALAKLKTSDAYRKQIEQFLTHPDQGIRSLAMIYLTGGPPVQ